MFLNINKSNLIWCIAYISAIICLAWIFPVLLFKFYPYSIIAILTYIVLTFVFSWLCFKKMKPPYKMIVFVLLALPVLCFILTLVSIQLGWIVYP